MGEAKDILIIGLLLKDSMLYKWKKQHYQGMFIGILKPTQPETLLKLWPEPLSNSSTSDMLLSID